jgi:hypothetical protein
MATRSTIWVKTDKGFRGIYCHFDGYLEGVGEKLYYHYKDLDKIDKLIDNSHMRSLDKTIEDCNFFNVDTDPEYTASNIKETEEYSEEYNYFYIDNEWFYYTDDEDSKNLKRLAPSLI